MYETVHFTIALQMNATTYRIVISTHNVDLMVTLKDSGAVAIRASLGMDEIVFLHLMPGATLSAPAIITLIVYLIQWHSHTDVNVDQGMKVTEQSATKFN